MKKFFSSILVSLMLLSASAIQAASVVTALATNSITSVLTVPAYLISVQVANATGVTATVSLVDAPSTVLTNVVGSFTLPLTYATNIVSTFTNVNGVVTSITNAAVFTASTTVAQSTNNYPFLNTLVIPANSTVVWSPINGAYVQRGLTATNNAVVTLTTSYAPVQ